ncbi:NAD(P)/FAD-dependent oxidoreductase [Nocardioides litoris]|uniref:NAD(P)/FAD-dependent oxidoreductase n=1 Tax=Nocardioides litoris TaxID=1926648 RepID=UPI00111F382F|nr:NAD(P)/FAD-dependent oxidoreductase [Nocardioides litoris]
MSGAVDLLVAGGGPAGLATALHASRLGLSVRVVEPREAVIDKACGEGLMPGALAALRDLGVDPAGHPITGIAYCAPGRRAETSFAAGPGRGVRRTVLHAALREAVLDAGVEVATGRVREVRQDRHGVTADGDRARYLVAADGLHSPLRRSLGLEVRPRGRPRWGQRRHVALAPWTDRVEVHWARDAEAYVTPVADDLVGVAVLSSRRAPYEELLGAFPALQERLAGAEAASTTRGAGPLRQSARRRVAGRVLLVGDAGGYVDALTGEGVALALGQAAAAARAVAASEPASYEGEWRRLTRRYRWLTAGLVAATTPRPARAAVVPAAVLLPPLFAAAVDALARPVG